MNENRLIGHAALAVAAAAFLALCSGPLWDFDLWWHLSSGKFFFVNKRFMDSDPFTFTAGSADIAGNPVLNGYWLGQVIMYLAYRAAGYYGIILLRAAVMTSALLSSYMLSRRLGAARSGALALFAASGLLLADFTGERPQLFSFLLFPHLFVLLESLRDGYGKGRRFHLHALGLLCMMMLWPSLHRGFLIGAALIAVYSGAEILDVMRGKREGGRPFAAFLAVAAVSLAATMLSPNGSKALSDVANLLNKSNEWQSTEFLSPVALALKHGYGLAAYWALLAFAAAALALSFRTARLSHMAVLTFLSALSLDSYRFIPFLLLLGLPIALGCMSGRWRQSRAFARISRAAAAAAVIMLLASAVAGYGRTLGASTSDPLMRGRFPKGAADFVMRNRPEGNMMNHYDWGGYLGWRLYPAYRVFIDGRSTSPRALYDYRHILWNEKAYGMILDRYGVDIIIMMPDNPFTGERYDLVGFLARDPQWHMVYRDDISMVYLRGESNSSLIDSYGAAGRGPMP